MNCFDDNKPTMNLRIGTVQSGANAAAEVVNEGTPYNTDWVINLTLPAVGDNSVDTTQLVDDSVTAAKIAAGAVTSEAIANGAVTANAVPAQSLPIAKLSDLPLSAQKQLYAHYIDISGVPSGHAAEISAHLYVVNSVSRAATTLDDLKNLFSFRCTASGMAPSTTSGGRDAIIYNARKTSNNEHIYVDCLLIGGSYIALELDDSLTISDIIVPLGSNAG